MTAGALTIAGCFLMVAFPEIAVNGCRAGLNLFAGTVLPTLFPFFVAVNFMIRIRLPERIGHMLEPAVRRVYGCGGIGAFIFIVSAFSGYPMAAKLVGDYCRAGKLSPLEGKRILSFSCVSGPLFLVGTVGCAMLGSAACGYLIALCHYGAALLNGLLFGRILLPAETAAASGSGATVGTSLTSGARRRSTAEDLSDGIFSAFRSLAQICGYIVIFSIASEFLQFSGLLTALPRPWNGAVVKGVLEMTMGCDAAAKLTGVSGPFRLALCGFFLAFGGLSIAGQSLSMLAESRIESRFYLFMKFCHGCLAAFLTMTAAMFAQRLGVLDAAAGLVYGSDREAVRVLGGIHSLIFSARSVGCIIALMAVLMAIDRLLYTVGKKIVTMRERRRRENV